MRLFPRGFTLAELLIALVILGVIATFTIPKVLMAQQDQKFNAVAKEAVSMVSGAYQSYTGSNGYDPNTTFASLTPSMSYIAIKTSGVIDGYYPQSGGFSCSAASPCMHLHSGAILQYSATEIFCNTTGTNAIFFYVDPDGKNDATANGPGHSEGFWLYANGRVRTVGTIFNPTVSGAGCANPSNATPAMEAPWFHWD